MTATHVLTLIAAPGSAHLSEARLAAAAAALEAQGAGIAGLDWLSHGEAADVRLVGLPKAFDVPAEGLDAVIQPLAHRRKRLLVSDMDSTMIEQECIDELADFAGLKAEVSKITEAAMNGELDFEAALTHRVALLAGMEEAVLERVHAERIVPMNGARTLLATMKRDGGYSVLVSGGFTFFTARVAAMLGFDEEHANVLETGGGSLSGTVRRPILGKEAKERVLRETAARLGIGAEESLAVGDGANDLPMLKAAGLGVAYRAKPAVRAEASAAIEHGDLTALLYLQGYRREEFAAD